MGKIHLIMFIAGNNARSRRTISLLTEACDQQLGNGSYQLDIIDILRQPETAEQKKILAIPTVARLKPLPEKRVIGELKDLEKAIHVIHFLVSDLPNHTKYV